MIVLVGSTSSTLEQQQHRQLQDHDFLVILVNVDGRLLASEVVDCSDGPFGGSDRFSDLGSSASC